MGLVQAVSPSSGRSRLVAGIGFRHEASAGEIASLIREALSVAGAPARLGAVATAADRAAEPAIRAAAAAFGLDALGIEAPALRAVDARVTTRSARMTRERGIGSLAEAAALAAAGEDARLVLPRIASANVTCALALACETP